MASDVDDFAERLLVDRTRYIEKLQRKGDRLAAAVSALAKLTSCSTVEESKAVGDEINAAVEDWRRG